MHLGIVSLSGAFMPPQSPMLREQQCSREANVTYVGKSHVAKFAKVANLINKTNVAKVTAVAKVANVAVQQIRRTIAL